MRALTQAWHMTGKAWQRQGGQRHGRSPTKPPHHAMCGQFAECTWGMRS